ncbi:GroES-like protein [Massarina eburnea CBS 473.64]|uniref:GroES-like protein n=1 Tax=Massarina eburnea CBS 473.64 TaxID=1395130 RepID=A0A6A6RVT2_9PLEO|nr:GroES-like protein [Massarina eburnea CBS 473.64]
MKEAVVTKGPKVEIVDSPIPEPPSPDHLVIQVVVSGSNPKDWKLPNWLGHTQNTGDDIAGIVHSVGSNVYEFKPGDRVASFHEMVTSGGSYAEYAVGCQHTTFHIPKKTTFEEAATIPLAAMTAALGLHLRLGLPEPWLKNEKEIPLVVYGGASAVGAYAIKMAVKSNIHPIIAVAGRGIPFVESIIDQSKGDVVIDYRKGDAAVVQGIKDALKGKKLDYAFDAVSEHNSYTNIVQVLESNGAITLVLPGKKYEGIPETVKMAITNVGESHKGDKDFAFAYFRFLARGLDEGWFVGHPHEVMPGGLTGVEKGLTNLCNGTASAVKYVFRIADTPGVKGAQL